jgi:hypothetical protein
MLDFTARPLNIALLFRSRDDRMADYYSVLARAVVNLDTGDGAAREELYERARSIIIAELRKQNPKIAALTITREQAALEAAIRRLEAELQPRPRNDDRKNSQYGRSDVAEADRLREMPKALAAMLFGCLSGGGHRLQWRRLSARSRARLCRHYPISDSAWRYGRSRMFIGSLILHSFSEAPHLYSERRSRQIIA